MYNTQGSPKNLLFSTNGRPRQRGNPTVISVDEMRGGGEGTGWEQGSNIKAD